MPRYFFDFDDGDQRTRDDEGQECRGPAAARDEALAVLPDIARDLPVVDGFRTVSATVRDERGRPICRATLTLGAEWLGLRPVE